ncbi:MAG TPA: hypothetical protein VI386_16095 [Candidatus Sulfotelmatobacter sp.]
MTRHWDPVTTTIALDARTTVEIGGYAKGKIRVESKALGVEEASFPNVPLDGPLGLIFAVVSFFGVHGLRIAIDAKTPIRSGLGGSGAVTVATIGALDELISPLEGGRRDLRDIVLLAHNLEDALYNNTGLQDQAAAAYGGVYLWHWQYGSQLSFHGEKLIETTHELDPHILVAYSGRPHTAYRQSTFLEIFRKTGNMAPLIQISGLAHAMAQGLRSSDYQIAASALSAESEVRTSFMDAQIPPEDQALISTGKEHGCGVRFSGHGGGGALWAIGTKQAIDALRLAWDRMLAQRGTGFVLHSAVSNGGLRVTRDDDQPLEKYF